MMDLAAEKKESVTDDKGFNANNNIENPQEIVYYFSTLADGNYEEAGERQARDMKAGLHSLKVRTLHWRKVRWNCII